MGNKFNNFLKAIGYLPVRPLEDGQSKGGFEDDPMPLPCNDPSHNPPGHLHIPQGKIYRHVCPSCGYTVVLRPPRITCGCDHKKHC